MIKSTNVSGIVQRVQDELQKMDTDKNSIIDAEEYRLWGIKNFDFGPGSPMHGHVRPIVDELVFEIADSINERLMYRSPNPGLKVDVNAAKASASNLGARLLECDTNGDGNVTNKELNRSALFGNDEAVTFSMAVLLSSDK